MCPMCWATAVSTAVLFFAVSLILVAGTDLTALALSGVLGSTALLHKVDSMVWLPWWWYVAVGAILSARVLYLAFLNRQRLLVVQAWQKGKEAAARRCSTKQRDPQ